MSHNIRIKGSLYGDPVGFAKRIAFWMNWLQPEALAMRARRTIRVEDGADFCAVIATGTAPCHACGSLSTSCFMVHGGSNGLCGGDGYLRECLECGAAETEP